MKSFIYVFPHKVSILTDEDRVFNVTGTVEFNNHTFHVVKMGHTPHFLFFLEIDSDSCVYYHTGNTKSLEALVTKMTESDLDHLVSSTIGIVNNPQEYEQQFIDGAKRRELTRKEDKHLDKIEDLLVTYIEVLKKEAKQLLYSGGIDVQQYKSDDHLLAKIVLSAAIERTKYTHYPLHKDSKKEVKNLLNM